MKYKYVFPGYPIDGNQWSEIQSINRYHSKKLVNWYRFVSVNRSPIVNHTKTVHRLLSIGSATSNRCHARYLSDHPPFLRSPGDKFRTSLLNTKNIPRCTSTRITHMPAIAFPWHNVYARRPGRDKVYQYFAKVQLMLPEFQCEGTMRPLLFF